MSSSCFNFRSAAGSVGADEVLELVAHRFALLSEPMRLKLVWALVRGEKHVNALVAETGATQTNASRQLHALAEAGILARRRSGPHVYYAIGDPAVLQLCRLACESIQRQSARAAALFR